MRLWREKKRREREREREEDGVKEVYGKIHYFYAYPECFSAT